MFFHAITICKILFGSDTLNEENYKPSSTKDTILRAISQVNQAQFNKGKVKVLNWLHQKTQLPEDYFLPFDVIGIKSVTHVTLSL